MKIGYSRRKIIYRLGVVLIIWAAMLPVAANAEPATEELIIFIQQNNTPVSQTFQQNILPEIQKMAQDLQIPVKIIPVTPAGVPSEVKITPLIVYQNHFGRSIYQGRTTTLNRIRTFIRTSRFIPQGKEPLVREQTPVWKMGRSRIWAPVKITPVTGTRPHGYLDEDFRQEALDNIQKGFQHFQFMDPVSLERADRGFYMDFYPWVSPDNTLYLSFAVFSQFHCKEPVFHSRDNPLTGPWEDRGDLFQKAARLMETVVWEKVRDGQAGDGFDSVAGSIPIAGWDDIGLSLPPAPEKHTAKKVNSEVPLSWVLLPPEKDQPSMVLFRFPAPLDNYSGEATRGMGEFQLPVNRNPAETTGYVEIDPKSVTMGQPDLDKVIQSSIMLNTKQYPVSRFTILSGEGETQKITFGGLFPVVFHGNLEIKGKTIPLQAVMEIEPVLNDNGEPLLILKGNFTIDLNDFQIPGPDGPEESNHILLLDVNFRLAPR
jgi:polyisoprenoid-binding protein YceI